ncbi:MAG: acetylglutamate kinase [Bacteroidales bacterium]|nr:acetylglutamate kinase [Bacteroidales bacterium]
MEQLKVIKVGGAVLEDGVAQRSFLKRFAALPGKKLLVHGGGRSASALAARLGLPARFAGGRRLTDAATLDLVTMVYGGRVNRGLVAALQGLGVNALGLCGADAGCIRATRRPPVFVASEDREIDYGFVGDISYVNAPFLSGLLEQGLVPVLAPLSWDGSGGLFNTNADTVASAVAVALSAHYEVELLFCFEKNGVLLRPDDPSSLIPELSKAHFEELVTEGVVSGGMLPKLENAFTAVENGVRAVRITSAEDLQGGTLIHG